MRSDHPTLQTMRAELEQELTRGILPYWMTRAVDERHGGFVGLITGDDVPVTDAPRSEIMNARILWTFSAAYRVLGEPAYHRTAERAVRYFREHFIDPVHGGVYWMVSADGRPLDVRKHVYAQAFAIYALSEHARATGDEASLRDAIEIFHLIERHAHDARRRGYEEAFSRNWVLLDDVRLSEVDANERRSMNTHLHVLEAYATLYRSWPDALVRERLTEVVELFLDHIVDPRTAHARPFFDAHWTPRSARVSFGHDIETSWLLLEAADVLGDPVLRSRVRRTSLAIASVVLDEAVDPEGGLFYEAAAGQPVDTDKEWWPQAEAIVGFVNAYQETGREDYLRAAHDCWEFVKRNLVDREHGEWYRRVARDGSLRPGHEKAGPWKCCYHNGRTCLELMARIGAPVDHGQPAESVR